MANSLMAFLDQQDRRGAATLFREWLRSDELDREVLAQFMLNITEKGRADLLKVVWETEKAHFLLNVQGNLCIHQPFNCNSRNIILFFIEKATEQDGVNLLEKRNQNGNTLVHLLVERERIDQGAMGKPRQICVFHRD